LIQAKIFSKYHAQSVVKLYKHLVEVKDKERKAAMRKGKGEEEEIKG